MTHSQIALPKDNPKSEERLKILQNTDILKIVFDRFSNDNIDKEQSTQDKV